MNANDLAASAYRAVVVTKDDAANLPDGICKGLYIGTAGTLKITGADGVDVAFANVAVGYLALKVKRVWSTGTAAAGIMAFYDKT
jgi:hypothetical protein